MNRLFGLLTLTALAMTPALPSVILDTVTVPCSCGVTGQAWASPFSVPATADLTGAAVFVNILPHLPATSIDFYIYSDLPSLPGTQLTHMTGLTQATGSDSLEYLLISGPLSVSLTLTAGTPYWLVVNLVDIAWELGGLSSIGKSASTSDLNSPSWQQEQNDNSQFQIFGDLTGVPEPGTLALAGAGIALVCLTRRIARAQRRSSSCSHNVSKPRP